jgi:hypothetical protein
MHNPNQEKSKKLVLSLYVMFKITAHSKQSPSLNLAQSGHPVDVLLLCFHLHVFKDAYYVNLYLHSLISIIVDTHFYFACYVMFVLLHYARGRGTVDITSASGAEDPGSNPTMV